MYILNKIKKRYQKKFKQKGGTMVVKKKKAAKKKVAKKKVAKKKVAKKKVAKKKKK
jgi:adenylate kinase